MTPKVVDDDLQGGADRPIRPIVWLTLDKLKTTADGRGSAGKVSNTTITDEGSSPLGFPQERDWLLSTVDTTDEYPDPNLEDQLIPKRLHKVYLSSKGGFPQSFYDMMSDETIQNMTVAPDPSIADKVDRLPWAHRSWAVFNPDYEIRYFDLHYCRLYLQSYFHPIMLRAFDCIEAFAGKVDLFRYLVLYREGGFYSDWKQECMADRLLDRLASGNITFIAANDEGLPQSYGSMQNSFLAATPRHPIFARGIEIILRNIQGRGDVNKEMVKTDVAWEMTSTIPLGRAFREVSPSLNTPGGARLIDFKALFGLRFFWGDEIVIVHKCYACGTNQSWDDGNNYIHKYEIGEFFCPDGPSLFRE